MKYVSQLTALTFVLLFTNNPQAAVIFDQSFDENNNIIGAYATDTQTDDFTPSSDSAFNNITIWASFWTQGQLVSPNFNFDIGSTLGGDDVFNSSTLIADSLFDTGLDHNNNGSADIYRMSFDLGQTINILQGVTYYLTVSSIREQGEDIFVWQKSSSTGLYWVGSPPDTVSGGASFQLSHVAQVPVPTSLALIGLGLVGLGFSRTRKVSSAP